jgi:flavodoxin
MMSTLVVYESMWGNSRSVAEAVAAAIGPEVRAVHVTEAPVPIPSDVDLLVVGGPTHAFSMSRPSTRRDAVAKGAPDGPTEPGVREWLARLEASDDLEVATFDTRVGSVRHLPGSAAKAAGKEVRRHHLGRLVATTSFYVDDMAGPLLPGELERARAWGHELAARPVARTGGA